MDIVFPVLLLNKYAEEYEQSVYQPQSFSGISDMWFSKNVSQPGWGGISTRKTSWPQQLLLLLKVGVFT